MRMWMINPKLLCNKHLSGEHVECHMLVGCINKDKSLTGYIENGLIEIHNIRQRHHELEEEMRNRGMKADSPLPKFKTYKLGVVDVSNSLKELSKRCPECRKRIVKEAICYL